MLMRTECTRAAVYRAAWMADHEPARAALPIAAAKAYAGDAGRFVCGEAIQLHGGVGFTWEYDPHVYFKRVKTLEQFYGSTSAQLELALAASLAYANVKRP
jgi:alkylation response protein AidB-like acyl-CoA dehydrogenase